jgi:Fe-S cluster biogenesis protein NfuA
MREQGGKKFRESEGPMLAMHGGSVELVEVTPEGVVKVRLSGACAGCPGAMMTLTHVIESALKDKVTGVTKVEAV